MHWLLSNHWRLVSRRRSTAWADSPSTFRRRRDNFANNWAVACSSVDVSLLVKMGSTKLECAKGIKQYKTYGILTSYVQWHVVASLRCLNWLAQLRGESSASDPTSTTAIPDDPGVGSEKHIWANNIGQKNIGKDILVYFSNFFGKKWDANLRIHSAATFATSWPLSMRVGTPVGVELAQSPEISDLRDRFGKQMAGYDCWELFDLS